MSTPSDSRESKTEAQLSGGDLEALDQIHGHLCNDCRLVWVGGYDVQELGLDPETSTAFSDAAQAFAESAKHISCADEEDTGCGYFDCLICNATGIDGYTTVVYMVP